MTCPDCDGEGVIHFQGCQVTCQKCKGGKTVPTLSEWWTLLDTVAMLREGIARLQSENEELAEQVERLGGGPESPWNFGEIG